MVDNKEQWEDIEYTDDAGSDSSYDSEDIGPENEYHESDYEQEYEDYEDEEEPKKKKGNPLPLLLLFLILIGVIAFVLVTKFGIGRSGQQQDNTVAANSPAVEQQMDNNTASSSDDLANSFFNEAGGDTSDMMSINFNENGDANVNVSTGEGDIVATVSEPAADDVNASADLFLDDVQNADKGQENNAIMVSYNKIVNANPFKPPVVKDNDMPYEVINNTPFEIIEPPVTSVPDENLTRLLQTQISGILYDEESPSAIVNLNGLDQFVKIGDTISGYTIQDITKNKVQISYKNNSYVAAVGELFTKGALEKKQAVDNLENKFAGRYKNNNNLEE